MEFYTIKDIQLLTGVSKRKALLIIKKLNKEIKERYKNYEPIIFEDKIEKIYFIKRMEFEL
ncbi:MAG TPA: transcriptional regulator [Candidatus Faecisoma merdavium]|nr:transcriptional regulator [Candidatus Faecisoma merdavium]